MCHTNNTPPPDPGRQAALITLVEEEVALRMRARTPFTALDVSNALKAARFTVRHSEVAPIVRPIHASGAMACHDYDRRLIPVITDNGTKTTRAFLYLHRSMEERDYAARYQDARVPVAADQARDLSDAVAANNPVSPLGGLRIVPGAAPPAAATRRSRSQRSGCRRRDGALAIPRALAARAGWRAGDLLTLTVGATADVLELAAGTAAGRGNGAAATVRVWADLRVRICKTKLRLAATITDAACARLALVNDVVRVEPPPPPAS